MVRHNNTSLRTVCVRVCERDCVRECEQDAKWEADLCQPPQDNHRALSILTRPGSRAPLLLDYITAYGGSAGVRSSCVCARA